MPFEVLITTYDEHDDLMSVHHGEIWYPMDEYQLFAVTELVMSDAHHAVATLHAVHDGHIVCAVLVEVATND